METDWKFLDTGAGSGEQNMSVDEELLARAQAGDATPVLRFYTWDPPAVSLGRFQKSETAVDAAACRQRGFDIVRRVTGGRAVLHHRELTYSVVARTDHPLFPSDILGTYKIIAQGLMAGFRNIGIDAEMVSHGGRNAPLVNKNSKNPSCFSSPSWYEIVVGGRKIAGSAQRRLSAAFLQHGSILISYDPAIEAEVIPGGGGGSGVTCINRELGCDVPLAKVKEAFRAGFSEALRVKFT
jgi:lipoate-protein ligase A